MGANSSAKKEAPGAHPKSFDPNATPIRVIVDVLWQCMQQGRHIAHKFESGWEVGVIKAFDKKDPHAGKFSVKYKDDPNRGRTLFCERVMEKTSTGFCCGSRAVIPLEVTMTVRSVSAGGPIFVLLFY